MIHRRTFLAGSSAVAVSAALPAPMSAADLPPVDHEAIRREICEAISRAVVDAYAREFERLLHRLAGGAA
jgi:hypothetical protein